MIPDIELRLNDERTIMLAERIKLERKLIPLISPQQEVLTGPFKGMRYTNTALVGSALIPKVLGSYELELHGWMEYVCGGGGEFVPCGQIDQSFVPYVQYTEVINIGSGEGYYAVGLAMRMPKTKVYAFEANADVSRACREMAASNGVSHKVVTNGACSIELLNGIEITQKGFVLCDCEGCELDILRPDMVEALLRCDLLVELHDFVDERISSVIKRRFKDSHAIESVKSTNRNPMYYPQIAALSAFEREVALAEYRPCEMEWVFMQALPQ
ncbi:MAG: hypothetical protein HQL04_00775 [Nitrospirae bacterium]|nr:hypothetical protein [Nitrospirota bacterium]